MDVKINNEDFGMFLVSDSVMSGEKIAEAAYRYDVDSECANGWVILDYNTAQDLENPQGLSYYSAVDVFNTIPVLFELFNCKPGTRIKFLYEEYDGYPMFSSLLDLYTQEETDIPTFLSKTYQ